MKIFLAAGVRQIKIPFITRKDPKDMNEMIESPGARPRIVIVGAGYAGITARDAWSGCCRARPPRS